MFLYRNSFNHLVSLIPKILFIFGFLSVDPDLKFKVSIYVASYYALFLP